MADEMKMAYEKKLEVFDTAQQLLHDHVRVAGLDTGHVEFLVQRAFALAETFHNHANKYLEGTAELDPLATAGMAPGMTGGKS